MVKLPSFHLMAKPVGASCNLDCDYCYFVNNKEAISDKELMSDELLDLYLKQLFESHETPKVTVAWQGGEPTLAGLEFYKKSVELAEKHKKPGQEIEYTIQTNGILLTDEWCEFFKENKFLVGISIDGPKELHDKYRKNKAGKSVFEKVVRGIKLLQKYNIEFNALIAVNSKNVEKPLEVYKYLRDDLGIKFMHFIPIVERDKKNKVKEFSVKPGQYGKFLNVIFDEWVRKDVGNVFVQMFDNALASWVQAPQPACVFAPACGTALILMPEGGVYSCDHFANKKNLLGNIKDKPLSGLVSSEKQYEFGQNKKETLTSECKNCDYLFACNGGCPKNRFEKISKEENKKNYLCSDYIKIFGHINKSMGRMAWLIRAGREASEIMNT
jgi:uncharacterized protein